MTRRVRPSLRATGQIGFIATAVNVTIGTADLLISRFIYTARLPTDSWQLRYYGYMGLTVVLATAAFWASSRPDETRRDRHIAITASGLTVVVGVLTIGVNLEATGSLTWWVLGKLVVGALGLTGAWACLTLSYLGEPLRLGETGALRSRSPWIWMIVAPLAGIDILLALLEHCAYLAYLPEARVVGLLAVGLLYGLMRRRHRMTGAARWSSATWPLIALIIPTYLFNFASAASSGRLVGRESVATTVAVMILAVVVGVHLATTRRHQRDGQRSDPNAAHNVLDKKCDASGSAGSSGEASTDGSSK